MIATLLVLLAASAVDSNRLSNPGFESGTAGWSLWARSSDSARFQTSAPGRTGTLAMEVSHDASRDWMAAPSPLQVSGTWQKVSSRLLVARGIGWIQPRLAGDGPR